MLEATDTFFPYQSTKVKHFIHAFLAGFAMDMSKKVPVKHAAITRLQSIRLLELWTRSATDWSPSSQSSSPSSVSPSTAQGTPTSNTNGGMQLSFTYDPRASQTSPEAPLYFDPNHMPLALRRETVVAAAIRLVPADASATTLGYMAFFRMPLSDGDEEGVKSDDDDGNVSDDKDSENSRPPNKRRRLTPPDGNKTVTPTITPDTLADAKIAPLMVVPLADGVGVRDDVSVGGAVAKDEMVEIKCEGTAEGQGLEFGAEAFQGRVMVEVAETFTRQGGVVRYCYAEKGETGWAKG